MWVVPVLAAPGCFLVCFRRVFLAGINSILCGIDLYFSNAYKDPLFEGRGLTLRLCRMLRDHSGGSTMFIYGDHMGISCISGSSLSKIKMSIVSYAIDLFYICFCATGVGWEI